MRKRCGSGGRGMRQPMDEPRYHVRSIPGRYPLGIVDRTTGEVVGRYYRASREAAGDHCRELNEGQRLPPTSKVRYRGHP